MSTLFDIGAPKRRSDKATRFAESNIQIGIVNFMRVALPSTHLAFSIPNGGYEIPQATAARLKREGLLPGVGDLGIIGPAPWIAFMEVKTADGDQSPEQAAFEEWCGRRGVPYAVVRSIMDAQAALIGWGVELRARAA